MPGSERSESEAVRGCVTPWECLRRRVKIKVLPLLQKTPTLPRNTHLHIQHESAENFSLFHPTLRVSGNTPVLQVSSLSSRICILFLGGGGRFHLLTRNPNGTRSDSFSLSATHSEKMRWVKVKFCCVMEPKRPEMTVLHTDGSF